MTNSKQKPVPVLLLGGQENALSVIRSLTRHGVPVSLSAPENCWALRSRHCAKRYPIAKGLDRAAFWEDLLLGPDHPELRGAVLLPCNDEGIEFMYNTQQVAVNTSGDDLLLNCVHTEMGGPDADGRRRPIPIAGSEHDIKCGMVIAAVGQQSECDELDNLGLMAGDRVSTEWDTMRTTDQHNERRTCSD